VLALAASLGGLSVRTALAACSYRHATVLNTPSVNSDGAEEFITLKTMSAPDWPSGGFALQAVWVGTNNHHVSENSYWVETGAVIGWVNGSNQYRFYTAHGVNGVYSEAYFSTLPAFGQTAWIRAYRSTTNIYRAEITYQGSTHSIAWGGHDLYTIDYQGGLEVTCSTNRVDRTFVGTNHYRRTSDGAWVDPTQGTINQNESPADMAWCTSPRLFRDFINNQIGSGCF
jgi:hypothetical protein